MRGIPPDVVAALISLGRSGIPDVPECLADQPAAWYVLVRGKETWRKVAEALSEDELRRLIQGIVLYSRARGRGLGGSASPVIFLYLAYIIRFPDEEPALTAWVVDNRVNCYEPFGSACDGGARTYAEFLKDRCVPWGVPWGCEIPPGTYAKFGAEYVEYGEYVRREELARERLQAEREAAAAPIRAAKATPKLANAVKRGDLKAGEALLAKGADPSRAIEGGGSLVALAEENGRARVAEYLRSLGIS